MRKALFAIGAFLLRTLLVCLSVFLLLMLLEHNSERYRLVQSKSKGASLRQLKRMLESSRLDLADELGKNHELVHSAFESINQQANESTVVVLCNREASALGTAITPDRVVTKASEISGRITCRLPNRKKVTAQLLAMDRATDLALLEVSGAHLTPINFAKSSAPSIGTWAFVPDGRASDPLSIGIVSANQRHIKRHEALLGIFMEQAAEGPQVMRVMDGSAAERIGLQEGDIIVLLTNQRVMTREQLIRGIQGYRPGEVVELKVLRDGVTLSLRAPLTRMDDVLAAEQGFDGHLGGPLSQRRSDFEQIIQHDCIVPAHRCGGPLMNLHGQAMGINIARAGRVSTYALPSALVVSRLEELGWQTRSFADTE